MFVRMEVFNKDGKDEWFKVLLIVVLQCDHIPTGKLNFRLSFSLTVFRSQIIVSFALGTPPTDCTSLVRVHFVVPC